MKKILICLLCYLIVFEFKGFTQFEKQTINNDFINQVFVHLGSGRKKSYVINEPVDIRNVLKNSIESLSSVPCIIREKVVFDSANLNDYTDTFKFVAPIRFSIIEKDSVRILAQTRSIEPSRTKTDEVWTELDESWVFYISNPIFSTDSNYCLFYSSSMSGGTSGQTKLEVYKRTNDRWEVLCELYHDLR